MHKLQIFSLKYYRLDYEWLGFGMKDRVVFLLPRTERIEKASKIYSILIEKLLSKQGDSILVESKGNDFQ